MWFYSFGSHLVVADRLGFTVDSAELTDAFTKMKVNKHLEIRSAVPFSQLKRDGFRGNENPDVTNYVIQASYKKYSQK